MANETSLKLRLGSELRAYGLTKRQAWCATEAVTRYATELANRMIEQEKQYSEHLRMSDADLWRLAVSQWTREHVEGDLNYCGN